MTEPKFDKRNDFGVGPGGGWCLFIVTMMAIVAAIALGIYIISKLGF